MTLENASDGGARKPFGSFVGEVYCPCGFIADQYDSGRYSSDYADPDTGMVLERCPVCNSNWERTP